MDFVLLDLPTQYAAQILDFSRYCPAQGRLPAVSTPNFRASHGEVGFLTYVAELEAGLISERTKAALKAAKAKGVKLGRHGAEVLAPQYREEARQRAEQLRPVITELKGLSLAKIAGELNKRKVPTPRGGRWDHSSVRNVIKRLTV